MLSRSGFHTEFFGGGGKNDAYKAMPPRGMWGCGGMLPKEFFVLCGCFWGHKNAGN